MLLARKDKNIMETYLGVFVACVLIIFSFYGVHSSSSKNERNKVEARYNHCKDICSNELSCLDACFLGGTYQGVAIEFPQK